MRAIIAAATAALLLAGCAGTGAQQSQTSAELLTASATVQAVDRDTRAVTLAGGESGEVFTVVAGDEVRNFDQIEVGDVVEIDFYHSMTLAMADPADPGNEITVIAGGRAPEGALPAAVAAESTSLVVEVINYDAATGIATYRTPDGLTRRSVVPPEMRSFASTLQRGRRVAVTVTDAVAVGITETAAS